MLYLSGNHARAEQMLRNPVFSNHGIEEPFLQQFAVVTEPHWNLLHPFIVPTAPAHEQRTQQQNAQQQNTILSHLQTWNREMHPTYGDLSELLSQLYLQQPISNVQFSEQEEQPGKCM